ncbi:RNA polymerase sigma-70 factor [Sunxiuqinia sp. A32]|uniref:RNA polymerase sigma-70 factor n=1 Tax=Sunxiuqinia sp. A32 TaxID=3461496 RepID=UPI0040455322
MNNNPQITESVFSHFKDGDELAFEMIFKSNYSALLGFCSQFINEIDSSKNIVQEAFINLWINRHKIENSNGIKAFLYTYIKSASLNYIRHNQVVSRYKDNQLMRKEIELNSEILDSFDFHSLEIIELEQLIQQAIGNLPDRCREVFILSRIEGKKNKEIADQLGISVKSVEANITRAIKTLKINLSEYLPVVLIQFIIQHFS